MTVDEKLGKKQAGIMYDFRMDYTLLHVVHMCYLWENDISEYIKINAQLGNYTDT
jgi:hypothetical protein